jgi:hypothetical protein
MELHTTAGGCSTLSVSGWRDELDAALVGAGRALQTVASVLLMADLHDLGLCQVQSPHAERPVITCGGGPRRRRPVGPHVRPTGELVDGALGS